MRGLDPSFSAATDVSPETKEAEAVDTTARFAPPAVCADTVMGASLATPPMSATLRKIGINFVSDGLLIFNLVAANSRCGR